MWQKILEWLLKNIWPAVQALMAKLLIDFAAWTFDQVKDSYREYNRREQDKAKQKAKETEESARQAKEQVTEAEKRVEEARRKWQEAEQRANQAQTKAEQVEAEIAKYKAEIESLKAQLEQARNKAEADKQKAVAGVWQEVAGMLHKSLEEQEDELEQIRKEALSRASETAASLKPEDAFPKDLLESLPPPDDSEMKLLQ